jgi:hypothetical protein
MIKVDGSGTLRQFCFNASTVKCSLACVTVNCCQRNNHAGKPGPKWAHVNLVAEDCWSSRPEADWRSLVEWLRLDAVSSAVFYPRMLSSGLSWGHRSIYLPTFAKVESLLHEPIQSQSSQITRLLTLAVA